MENEKKITKIVVSKEDELTDIITGILDSTNERIILTFAEESDLLISPINLKVILETADETEKSVIAQIINNPTGLRNANLAGLTTLDTPNYPPDELWTKVEMDRARRVLPPSQRREIPIPEEQIPEKTTSGFQNKINSAIERSRLQNIQKEDDVLITFDEDLPSEETTTEKESPVKDLSKIDFKKTKNIESPQQRIESRKKKGFDFKSLVFWKKKTDSSTTVKGVKLPIFLKKYAPIGIISLVGVSILLAFIYYNTVPFVKIRIYVAAKEVSIEKIFTGDENIKAIDFENSKIPIKTETVEKARSTTIQATGVGYKGTKATGKVALFYLKPDCTGVSPINIATGTQISVGDKAYVLDAGTTVNCNGLPVEVAVTAIDLGEEYNIASGQKFVVQSFSSEEVFALNSSGAFTGGSKEQLTILSQADVNSGIEELEKIAKEEGEQELKDKNGEWEIITDSITSQLVKDSTTTDVKVGAEANQVNLSIKTKSTATYFFKSGFDEGVSGLLTQEAQSKNLFESDDDLELALGDDVEKEITVAENNKNGIKIKLVATASVKPKVDKEDIINRLETMKWEEGLEYLKNQTFAAKETEVSFNPSNFPEQLKHFPNRQGGVMIEIKEVL